MEAFLLYPLTGVLPQVMIIEKISFPVAMLYIYLDPYDWVIRGGFSRVVFPIYNTYKFQQTRWACRPLSQVFSGYCYHISN